MLKKILLLAGISSVILLGQGCLGYRTTGLSKDISSVNVKPFSNLTTEPDIGTAATSATIREFQKDGSLKVTGADEADAIVEATITGITLEPLRFSRDRATETTEFRLTVTADITVNARKTGKVITSAKQLTGKTSFSPEGDLASSKRTAIQPAVQDLAHQVVAAVVEAW